MDRSFRRFRVAFVSGVVMLTLTAFAGSVSAAPGPTPAGLTGACNMLNAWGVGTNGGMKHAMQVDNQNGNDGMWRAVDVSNGNLCS